MWVLRVGLVLRTPCVVTPGHTWGIAALGIGAGVCRGRRTLGEQEADAWVMIALGVGCRGISCPCLSPACSERAAYMAFLEMRG